MTKRICGACFKQYCGTYSVKDSDQFNAIFGPEGGCDICSGGVNTVASGGRSFTFAWLINVTFNPDVDLNHQELLVVGI